MVCTASNPYTYFLPRISALRAFLNVGLGVLLASTIMIINLFPTVGFAAILASATAILCAFGAVIFVHF